MGLALIITSIIGAFASGLLIGWRCSKEKHLRAGMALGERLMLGRTPVLVVDLGRTRVGEN